MMSWKKFYEQFYMYLERFYVISFRTSGWDVFETTGVNEKQESVILNRLEFKELCLGEDAYMNIDQISDFWRAIFAQNEILRLKRKCTEAMSGLL